MARSFAGGASTDNISFGNVSTSTYRTFSLWLYLRSVDGVSRRLWDWSSGADIGENIIFTSTNASFSIGWTTSNGSWTCPTPATNQWVNVVGTYDGSSVSNDIAIYYDGVSQSMTETSTPSGTLKSGSYPYAYHNRAGNDRCLDAISCEFARWNRVLSISEIDILKNRFSPINIPSGLVRYNPLYGNGSTEQSIIQATSGTVTGTTKSSHPRIFYPQTSRSYYISAGGGGASAGVLGTSVSDLEYAAYAVKTGLSGVTLNEQKLSYYRSIVGQSYASVIEAEVAFLKYKTGKWTETSLNDLWASYLQSRGVPNYSSIYDMKVYFFLNVGFE